MDQQTKAEVARDVFPFIQVLKDGTIRRLVGTEVTPAGFDTETGVLSKDVVIIRKTGVKARLYRPTSCTNKLPLVVYFHGGGFFTSTIAEPKYHDSLNKIVAEANILLVSIDYRLAPENPLPVAYEDSWAALQWVASHVDGEGGGENWINDYADLGKLFLAGDSAGANISHHLGLKIKGSDLDAKLKIRGIIMIHPYFWGQVPIGKEATDHFRKSMVDNWWSLVCPSEKENDDPLINPFVDGSPSLAGLACDRVLLFVAENDILRDRGWLYYEKLKKSGWEGKVEIVETEGVDHVFHILDPSCEKVETLFKGLSSFINHGKAPVAVV
ncbi:hypothetical protein HS088_TW11G00774 [Tripterygium wilfordii]|uniref:Alpha/beta hydrolase fold-3 domain-containing protein n=1 Tax=Tripterygium wilfordii TaxID=458696 RepID=A0A7J7D2X7_TRIWF|nr:probable carboxylesterase 2 [Tripterygium wilfordii]KAF5740697.1 hypothetical protein HS088_TW11G00774 [Tripterygium wilfordii]